jgi:hypothetical protein
VALDDEGLTIFMVVSYTLLATSASRLVQTSLQPKNSFNVQFLSRFLPRRLRRRGLKGEKCGSAIRHGTGFRFACVDLVKPLHSQV